MRFLADSFSSLPSPPAQESTCRRSIQRLPGQESPYQAGQVVIGDRTPDHFIREGYWSGPGEVLLALSVSLLYRLSGVDQEVGIAHAVDHRSGDSPPLHPEGALKEADGG